jgi:hypothetical protein
MEIATLKHPNQSSIIKPRRPRAKPLVRHIVTSDYHKFIGRIYDLSIIGYHFENYEDLARYPDCKYAFHVNETLSILVRRVESLNLVGDMLWPRNIPDSFRDFPVSRHEWLTIAADVFLMRFFSVVDCALMLTNDIYETSLEPKKCTIDQLRKSNVPLAVLSVLSEMGKDKGNLRSERNARFHHGEERSFTDDSVTFWTAAIFEKNGNPLTGSDQYGRRINIERSFKEGLVELQREFNAASRQLIRQINVFYDLISIEFDSRFTPRFHAATHGLNVRKA